MTPRHFKTGLIKIDYKSDHLIFCTGWKESISFKSPFQLAVAQTYAINMKSSLKTAICKLGLGTLLLLLRVLILLISELFARFTRWYVELFVHNRFLSPQYLISSFKTTHFLPNCSLLHNQHAIPSTFSGYTMIPFSNCFLISCFPRLFAKKGHMGLMVSQQLLLIDEQIHQKSLVISD